MRMTQYGFTENKDVEQGAINQTGGRDMSKPDTNQAIKLMQGDCLERMKEIESESVDLTVTSPPYDNLRSYNGNNALWCQHVWEAVIKDLYRVTADGGVVVWIVADATIKGSETGTSFKQALCAIECGFNLHDTMIWTKPNPIPRTHNRYEQQFEYMFILSKGKPKSWNGLRAPSKYAGAKRGGTIQMDASGRRKQKNTCGVISSTKLIGNVWVMPGESKTDHPASFPEKLACDHIISWSNEGDTVFDCFMGSGTTGVACINTNRKFIGIELDKEYFNIAKKRIERILK